MHFLYLVLAIEHAALVIFLSNTIDRCLDLISTNMNKKEKEQSTKASVSSDTCDLMEEVGSKREKRTIFDTVLHLPENIDPSNHFEKSSDPMPIIDDQVLLDSLRDASREGIISRQPRSVQMNGAQQQQQQQQRTNNRGPLF